MYLKTNVNDASDRYGSKLSQQQLHINVLEKGFRLLCVSIKEQTCMYQILLNVTQMLETEIAEYKRLLDEESRPGGNAKKMIVVRKEWKVDNESITFTSNSK
ncbi:hypothetical protein DPEC_G00175050 [Dallia pectoralis]|uniref:Uncharacterized protein n=1 Tax=Dallia pectoralis TaxID=75939 RepID=A0ACC2GEM0_DALPE|nr:hypothetical protein DPEC_G00175050 [Dallia pectoralis]